MAPGQIGLASRADAGRHVEDERRLVAGRRRDRDRVGAERRSDAAGLSGLWVGVGHRDADHAARRCHARVVGGDAEVARVGHRDDPGAGLFGLADRDLHRPGRHDDAHAAVAVVERGRVPLGDDPVARPRVDPAAAEAGDVAGVAGQPGDAVGIDPGQVGRDHDPDDEHCTGEQESPYEGCASSEVARAESGEHRRGGADRREANGEGCQPADRAVELERCYLEELARRLGVDLRLRLRVAEEELVAAYRRARARGAAPTSSHTGRGRTSPRASRDTSRRWCGGAEGSSSWQRGRQVARAWEYYRELELRVTRYRERLAPVLLGARAPRRTGG